MDTDALICAALRSTPADWPASAPAGFADEVLHAAVRHGVAPLLHASPSTAGWPIAIRQALRRHALEFAQWEMRHDQAVREVLDALAAARVRAIVIKGTALAHSLYPAPVRTRGDTDILVPPAAAELAIRTLQGLGFGRHAGVSGEFVATQASFTRHAADGSRHTVDLHWQFNNSHLLARVLTYDDLMHCAQPLPGLGPNALAPCAVHALAIACLHRCTHRHNPYHVDGMPLHDENRLIWVYDIHLLAARMAPSDWDQLRQFATRKHLLAVCADGLAAAARSLGTQAPALAPAGPSRELPWRYLRAGAWQQRWLDLRALPGARARVRWIHETLFPPPSYMRWRYGDEAGERRLAWLYLRRMIGPLWQPPGSRAQRRL